MSEKHDGRRHAVHLFLMVPAFLMLARAARRHRMMGDPGSGQRLPPKIEAMLTSWHVRAHQAADVPVSPTA